jgi:para-aminobenzoate synthetase/4-amino-4-deoxychorismate lyase
VLPDSPRVLLRELTARPYRVPLPSDASPSVIISRLDDHDHPGVLWGDWFGGGVLIFTDPLLVANPTEAAQAFDVLDELPKLDPDPADRTSGVIGGGWLACLGYDTGSTSCAFYDSLLRWTPVAGWCYESLGLEGRDDHDRNARSRWSAMLDEAPAESVPMIDIGLFHTRSAPSLARDRHLAAIEGAIGRIHRGSFYQVNLCTRLHAETSSPVPMIFAVLAERLQPTYGGLVSLPPINGTPRAVASFSPELFLSVHDDTIKTAPIKGTAPRASGAVDSPELRTSTKDAAENVMIVDLMRNDLSRVCRPGTVQVDELLSVQPAPGVWHLVSTVSGKLQPGRSTVEVLTATFPPGSVTGAPKIAAQQGIHELEDHDRGAYTGALGLVSPYSGTELNVIIRTFEIAGRHVQLGVGGGITVDSVPIREWYECLHKAAPLVTAAGSHLDHELTDEPGPVDRELTGQGVFESILVRHGKIIRLAAHLARLDRSCRELYGQGLPDDLAGRIVAEVSRQTPAPRCAIRLQAHPEQGALSITTDYRPLGTRLESSSLRRTPRVERSWRHKWVDRASIEVAERNAGASLPYFTPPARPELITETSRGNLFLLQADGAWCTPPLDEQVLPGVTRREVIDILDLLQARHPHPTVVQIRPCSVEELRHARGAFWTSALSGAVGVTAVDGFPLPDVSAFLSMINNRLGVT